MDTNRIKRFATEARNILKAGIAAKITTLGFDKNGNVAEENKPQLMQGGSLWNEQLQTEGFYYQWMSLYNRIQQKGISEVYEEAAYTWFNRLCAIRILQKNNLCSPVLAYADAARTPVIVDEARQGRIPQMKEELRQRLVELLDDDTKVTEQFAILITAWCHDNPIINQCFGSIADYTELLLPNNILAEGGFVDMLNHTEFITDEDFQSPELIGWLYQFYISERKDEVFAKKGKFEADEIPAATQIFTPNWIVKYMVQNTVGRIYLDNNPYETQLQKKWRYLIYNSECKIYNSGAANTTAQPIINSKLYTINYSSLEELKVADLACGSGHILNECFDLLYDLYIAEGYGRGEAVENIFRHNLTGIDLDTRAKQLSQFALLLKACQKDAGFADAHCLPNVLTMPKPWNSETQGPIQDMLHIYFRGEATNQQEDEIMDCFDLMQDADSLGSIMKFDISESTRLLIQQTTDYWCSQEIVPEEVRTQIAAFKLILALTEKYHALVMNPPYMGGGNMNFILNKYAKEFYNISKGDLATIFVEMMGNKVCSKGKYAFIIPPSWMFLPSFEKLRKLILENHSIDSFVHLSNGAFGGDFGSTPCVISKIKAKSYGIYFRIVEKTFQFIDQKHLEIIFLNALKNHEYKFDFATYDKANPNFADDPKGKQIYYDGIDQHVFFDIPGTPIAYWLGSNVLKCFQHSTIKEITISDGQTKTGDNNKYLRMIWEVSSRDVGKERKWVKHPKGGAYRRWYGNIEWLIDWSDNARQFYRSDKVARILPEYLWWKNGISWTLLTSGKQGYRDYEDDCIFNLAAPTLFFKSEEDRIYTLGLLNTPLSVMLIGVFNPTINNNIGDIQSIPYIKENCNFITNIVKINISISKFDWDAHETSWDFQRNELLSIDTDTYMENINYEIEKHFEETGEHICIDPAAPKLGSLEWRMEQYKTKWEHKFMQLHKNEEELNRQFIDIYGLQDELTPDVPLNEITILQQGEISIE